MKQDQIEIGAEYLTRIGGQLARVKVLSEVERQGYGLSYTGRARPVLTRYRIARVSDGRPLPKVRTASALHRPAFDRTELEAIHALKTFGGMLGQGLKGPELNEAFRVYRFLRAVGCP